MLVELTDLIGMEVYTNKGTSLGTIDDLIVEVDTSVVTSLYVSNPNPLLVENSVAVAVPFRWIESVGDVILLKYFPKFVGQPSMPEESSKFKDRAHQLAHAAEEKLMAGEKRMVDDLKTFEKKVEGRVRKQKEQQ